MRFPTARLEDVLETLIDYRGKTPTKTSAGVRLITAKVIKDGFINDSSFEYVAENEYESWMRRGLPKVGDLLVTTEAPLGEVARIVDERVALAQRVILLRADRRRMNPRFLFHAFKSPFVQAELRKRATGTTVLGIKQSELREIQVPLPLLSIQQRISDVLSPYDDLIENNTKRIKILEEMARSLYREWFIEFRFPGHKEVKSIKAATLQVPDGWRAETLGDWALNFDSKRRPLSGAQRAEMKGDYPYYGAAKIIDRVNAYLFDGRYLLVAEDGSVITADRRPVLQIASGRFWVNNHTHILQGKAPVSTDLLYLRLKELDVSPYITGAAQPKITQANLNRIPLLVPPPQLLGDFDKLVGPLLTLTETLQSKNDTLVACRALLLPRLLSGEIELDP